MSRKPDYEQMKQMVAQREAENLPTSQIEDILYYGLNGYKYDSDAEIMEIFLQLYDAKDIPKIKTKQEQCEKCTYVVCACKPVPFYTSTREK